MKFKRGDKVTLTAESQTWTGPYSEQEVTIVCDDKEEYYTVETVDGKRFMCPIHYFKEYRWSTSQTKCECGAHATSFRQFHSPWCPMYKDMK